MKAKKVFTRSAANKAKPLNLYDFEQSYQELCTTSLEKGFSDLIVTKLLYPYYDFKTKLKIDWTSQNTVRALKDVPFSEAMKSLQKPLQEILSHETCDIALDLRHRLESFLPAEAIHPMQPPVLNIAA